MAEDRPTTTTRPRRGAQEPAGEPTSPAGVSDPGEQDPGRGASGAGEPGGNPLKDPAAHAGGERPAGQKMAQANAAQVAAVTESRPAEVERGDSALVTARDDSGLEELLEAAGADTYVTVTKEVLEEFYYPDTRRPSYRVLFHRGQVIARSVIEQRAAVARAARLTGLAATVDATTLASGTALPVAVSAERALGATTDDA